MTRLKIEKIVIDAGTQTRAKLNDDMVTEYAEAMTEGAKFEPVVVYFDGSAYLLADGFHRVMAAIRNGWKDIEAEIKKGGRLDAIRYSLTANNRHGLRRTNADKRYGVDVALREFGKMSDQVIADMCGVSRKYVLEIRHETPPQVVTGLQPDKRIGVDGKTYPGPVPRDPGPPPAPRNVEKDPNGKVIPKNLLELWGRAQEIQDMCTQISRIRTAVERGFDEKDKLFAEGNQQSIQAALDQAYTAIKATMPYCVCPSCSGDGCRACCQRGLIGKFRYDNTIPSEMKKK
jgi:hypothetical protein